MKLKFTLEVCTTLHRQTFIVYCEFFVSLLGRGLCCEWSFFFWQAACLMFCFSYVSRCLHTRVCVCVSPCTCTTPPLLAECCVTIPAWDHCEVRLLVLFFITTSSKSSFFCSFMSLHFQECLTILFAKTKLFCFYYKLIHMSVLHLPFHLILFYHDFIS